MKNGKQKLAGGVAVIRVGAPSEIEMKQKKQVFEDSLNATRAAQESGFVPGGGVALLRASRKLKELKLSDEETMTFDPSCAHARLPLNRSLITAAKIAPFI